MVMETEQLLESTESSEEDSLEVPDSSDEETEFDESVFDGLQSVEED